MIDLTDTLKEGRIGQADIIGQHEPGTPEWHALRRGGIGGSEVAPVLGLSPWSGPHKVWMQKIDPAYEDDFDESARVRMAVGRRLEPLVLELLADETGLDVVPAPVAVQHPDHDWWRVNLDGLATDGERLFDVEAKTTHSRAYPTWRDEGVPLYYQCQAQYQLGATDLDVCFVPALFGNADFDYWKVERDEADIEALEEALGEFWQYVESEEAPPIDGSSAAFEYLVDKYGDSDSDKTIELGASADELARAYQDARTREKQAKADKKEATAKLLDMIGEAKRGETPDGFRITSVRRSRFSESAARETDEELVEQFCARLDKRALRREHPDFYSQHKQVSSMYVRITAPDDE